MVTLDVLLIFVVVIETIRNYILVNNALFCVVSVNSLLICLCCNSCVTVTTVTGNRIITNVNIVNVNAFVQENGSIRYFVKAVILAIQIRTWNAVQKENVRSIINSKITKNLLILDIVIIIVTALLLLIWSCISWMDSFFTNILSNFFPVVITFFSVISLNLEILFRNGIV